MAELSETIPTFLSIQDLIDEGFIKRKGVIDPRNSEVMNGCVVINYDSTKKDFRYNYKEENCAISKLMYDPTILSPYNPNYSCFTFDETTETITNYDSSCSKDVVIPKQIYKNDVIYNIKYIGSNSFTNKQIKSLVLQDGILEINDGTSNSNGAFAGNQITALNIPQSLTKIGGYAFYGNQITSLSTNGTSNLEIIDTYAFSNSNISSLNLSNLTNLTRINNAAFRYNLIPSVDLSFMTK
ncbi:MAG: leucine-rich repeat domain-containing protein [Bacilli bacterium]|nr:leucine-rich repeat domain-containing protein [Bacilli bacterium]MDD4809160.1 leucine-rich repeat domain-containing protein [Bacilli bacterium]